MSKLLRYALLLCRMPTQGLARTQSHLQTVGISEEEQGSAGYEKDNGRERKDVGA